MSGTETTLTDSERDERRTPAVPTAEVGVAFITYALLLFVRVSGLAGLFRYPHPRNPLAAPPLRAIGEFVFFDLIVLAVVGLIGSGTLLGLALADVEKAEYRRVKLGAATCVGLPALVYVLGSVLLALS